MIPRRWTAGALTLIAAAALSTTSTATSAAAAPAAPGSGAAAQAAPPIGTPGDVSQIRLVSTSSGGGWTYRFYRNLAYPCSISGYHTFTVATRDSVPPGRTAPLWVYLHGGGVGWFDENGVPRPDAEQKVEETAARQRQSIEMEDVLTDRVLEAAPTARVLAVSMCNHDLYGGVGLPDPNHPSGGRTYGLLSTKAAVQFATTAHPTDDYFLYGTSAGSYGSYHVAWGLQQQGLPPTALVADSGVWNRPWQEAKVTSPVCGRGEEAFDIIPRRMHPAITVGTNDPDQLVSSGRLRVPVLDVWTINDRGQCGTDPMPCPLRDGSTPTMGSVDCEHEPLRRAIAAQGADSRSDTMRLCVTAPGGLECARHVPTKQANGVNTLAGEPADFMGKIVLWVAARGADD